MKRHFVILTLLMLLLYLIATVVFSSGYNEYKFKLLPAIPAYFLMLGSITISLLKQIKGNGVNMILGIKVVRLLLSLLIVFIYVFAVKTKALSFVLTFATFFLAYLVFETWMLLDWNKKKNTTNNELQ